MRYYTKINSANPLTRFKHQYINATGQNVKKTFKYTVSVNPGKIMRDSISIINYLRDILPLNMDTFKKTNSLLQSKNVKLNGRIIVNKHTSVVSKDVISIAVKDEEIKYYQLQIRSTPSLASYKLIKRRYTYSELREQDSITKTMILLAKKLVKQPINKSTLDGNNSAYLYHFKGGYTYYSSRSISFLPQNKFTYFLKNGDIVLKKINDYEL